VQRFYRRAGGLQNFGHVRRSHLNVCFFFPPPNGGTADANAVLFPGSVFLLDKTTSWLSVSRRFLKWGNFIGAQVWGFDKGLKFACLGWCLQFLFVCNPDTREVLNCSGF